MTGRMPEIIAMAIERDPALVSRDVARVIIDALRAAADDLGLFSNQGGR